MMAPDMATPNMPPSWRKNAEVAVAEPISRVPTAVLDRHHQVRHDETETRAEEDQTNLEQCNASARGRCKHDADKGNRGGSQAYDRKNFVSPGPGHETAAHERGHDHAAGHGCEHQPRTRGCHPEDELEKERQEHSRAEESHEGKGHDARGDHEDLVVKDVRGEHGFRGTPLLQHEQYAENNRDKGEPDDDRGRPGILHTAPGEDQEERHGRGGEQHGAGVVDAVRHFMQGAVKTEADERQCNDAERDVHVKDPAPREGIGDEASQKWAGNA